MDTMNNTLKIDDETYVLDDLSSIREAHTILMWEHTHAEHEARKLALITKGNILLKACQEIDTVQSVHTARKIIAWQFKELPEDTIQQHAVALKASSLVDVCLEKGSNDFLMAACRILDWQYQAYPKNLLVRQTMKDQSDKVYKAYRAAHIPSRDTIRLSVCQILLWRHHYAENYTERYNFLRRLRHVSKGVIRQGDEVLTRASMKRLYKPRKPVSLTP